jgi:DNA replication and repair protein RecF
VYRAALARRNAALRESARTGDESAAAVWEPALAEHGAALVCARTEWISQRSAEFSRLAAAIGESGEARMSYSTSLSREGDTRDAIEHALVRHRRHDLRRGMTHSGPHRDDLALTLDGRELRLFGSAGQQRTAAIALRMLESDTIRASRGVAPVLLLDDPFAELDVRRSGRILSLLHESGIGQTILVVPRDTDIPPELLELDRREISAGRVS